MHRVAFDILITKLDVRDFKLTEEKGVSVVQTAYTNHHIPLCRAHEDLPVLEVGFSCLKIESPGVLLLSLCRIPLWLEICAHTNEYEP